MSHADERQVFIVEVVSLTAFFHTFTDDQLPKAFCVWVVHVCNACVHEHILTVCEHFLQTTRGNCTWFTALVQLETKMNWLDFEVKGSKIKVTVRLNIVQKGILWILKVIDSNVTLTDDPSGLWFSVVASETWLCLLLLWSGEGISSSEGGGR